MNKYIATVIKIGNSYVLRVPKSIVDNARLILGQKIQVSDPLLNTKS
jgi:antitoxin component of MazEF toxin-antitoxin module